MQQIERYGVIALLFMIVTFVTVSLWDGGEEEPVDVGTANSRSSAPVVHRQQPAPNRRGPILTQRPIPERQPERRQVPLAAERATPQLEPDRFADAGHTPHKTSVELPSRIRMEKARYNSDLDLATERADLEAVNQRMRESYEEVKQAHPDPEPDTRPRPMRSYVVRPGDSFQRIAKRELGDANRWKEIQALNGGIDPRRLMVGVTLKIEGEASAPTETPAKPPAPNATKTPGPKVATTTYTVKRGDILGKIAQRELGSAQLWSQIVDLNPGVDPNRLLVGAVLKLPKVERPAVNPERQLVAKADSSRSSRPRVR